MPEFLKLIPPEEAVSRYLETLAAETLDVEEIPTMDADGRVLAEAFSAPHPLPPFDRSSVDGFAVRAVDTFGASPSLPAYLAVAGEVPMGAEARLELQPGQAAVVHTGGMIPSGATAVVMLEDTQPSREGEIEVQKPAADGENILRKGEDVSEGEELLTAGTLLRVQEIGGLMAYGRTSVRVYRRPGVGILSSGDEVVPPDEEPGRGQVRDINSYTLAAMVKRNGGIPHIYGIAADTFEDLEAITRRAYAENDMVLITAGSSVSARDITADVIRSLGEPGVLYHGLALRPGKPTILAIAGGKPIIGLPGNPVSAVVAAGLTVVPVLHRVSGRCRSIHKPYIDAVLSQNVPSVSGREDYLAVRLTAEPDRWTAEPVFGRSNLIYTLVRADGLIRIPAEVTGLRKDTPVRVFIFQ